MHILNELINISCICFGNNRDQRYITKGTIKNYIKY